MKGETVKEEVRDDSERNEESKERQSAGCWEKKLK